MAKPPRTPRTPRQQPAAAPTTPTTPPIGSASTQNEAEADVVSADASTGDGPKRWLRLAVSLAGPGFSVAPGDKRQFDDTPAADGGPSEAERLVDAGFAADCEPPAAEG